TSMPKAELHFHLEGAIPVPTLWKLIQHHGGDPVITSQEQLVDWFTYSDFAHFMETWTWMNTFLRTYDDFTFAAEAVARHLVEQNILYVEAFFSPSDFRRHKLDPQDIALAIRTGLNRVDEVEVPLIVDLVQDRGPEGTGRTLAAITEVAAEAGVIGIGIGGFEAAHPPEQFAGVYRDARESGFHVTAHAGEEAGPESVWGALLALGAERIGHGIRSVEDPALVRYLVEHQIPLEVCPTSNLRTGVVAHWDQHPVGRLVDAGALVTINTDDPAMFDVTMAGEYSVLEDRFGMDETTLKRLSLAVVDASWADNTTRVRLRTEIEQWWVEG
ncbi:MAG TPA: adenosine deaminase, partial [Acidimicrobiia bacterium]|nr:adenosine deaminase [Acidimicrobiia bacterium]